MRTPRTILSWRTLRSLNARVTRVPKPWQHGATEEDGALLLHASGVVEPSVRQAVRQLLPRLNFDRDSDSVDGNPSFEIRWVRGGQYTHGPLRDVLSGMVEEKLLPLLRASPLGAHRELVLCEALVRIYDDGQRRVHPAHYDADALVTAVMEIDVQDDSSQAPSYTGPGFFVQPGAHVDTRLSVRVEPGDVVAHSFDLQHGVEVHAGRRCSVVLWFTDSVDSCLRKTRPWYRMAAAEGDADAQYNLAKGVLKEDPRGALSWMRSAAEQGHFMAMNDLAVMLMEGRGLPGAVPDLAAAEQWLRRSSELGFHRAMLTLSMLCSREPERHAEAYEWLSRAAAQRADPAILHSMGLVHLHGALSVDEDVELACTWFREAAASGHPDAQLALGRLLSERGSELGAAEESRLWLARAAEQGKLEVTLGLAKHYARAGDIAQLAKLALRCGRQLSHLSSKWRWMGRY